MDAQTLSTSWPEILSWTQWTHTGSGEETVWRLSTVKANCPSPIYSTPNPLPGTIKTDRCIGVANKGSADWLTYLLRHFLGQFILKSVLGSAQAATGTFGWWAAKQRSTWIASSSGCLVHSSARAATVGLVLIVGSDFGLCLQGCYHWLNIVNFYSEEKCQKKEKL